MSVTDYLTAWLDRQRTQLRPSTAESYRNMLSAYALPHLGELELRAVDHLRLERLYGMLLDRGGRGGKPLSIRTVRYTHAVLHRAFEHAVLDGLLDDNPAARARPPKVDPVADELDEPMQVWDGEQARVFLRHVEHAPLGELWTLALCTGLRRSELLGLRWEDVDLEAAQLTVRRSLTCADDTPRLLGTKTSRNRTMGLDPLAVAALERRRRQQAADEREAGDTWANRWGLVFTTCDGRPHRPVDVSHAFARLVSELPLPRIRLHDLRHTHATLLIQAGIAPKVVAERLGHAEVATTLDIYSHVLPAMDAEAVAAIGAVLNREAEDKDGD